MVDGFFVVSRLHSQLANEPIIGTQTDVAPPAGTGTTQDARLEQHLHGRPSRRFGWDGSPPAEAPIETTG